MEPISLALLGGAALSEGVKFLYARAGGLLDRRRAKRDKAKDSTEVHGEMAGSIQSSEIIKSDWPPIETPMAIPDELKNEVHELLDYLEPYAAGTSPVESDNSDVVEAIDALRKIVEVAYGRDITFIGEQRSTGRSSLRGEITVEEVVGYAAAVRIRRTPTTDIHAKADAKRVEAGGQLIGLDIDFDDSTT